MSRVIRISEANFKRLQSFAEPLIDSTDSVFGRVLDLVERRKKDGDDKLKKVAAQQTEVAQDADPEKKRERTDLYTNRRPFAYEFKGEKCFISTYKGLYVCICKMMFNFHSSDFNKVLAWKIKQSGKPIFSTDQGGMLSPYEVGSSGIYTDTHGNAKYLIKRCYALLKLFGHPRTDLKVYTRKR